MKTYRGSRGTASLILNFEPRWRWVVNITPRLLQPGKEPRYLLNRRLGGPQKRSGRFGEGQVLLPLPRFEPPDRPVHSLKKTTQITLSQLFLSSHCWSQGRRSQDWTRPAHTVCCPDTPFSLSADGREHCNGPTENVTGAWEGASPASCPIFQWLQSGVRTRTMNVPTSATRYQPSTMHTLHLCRYPEWDSGRKSRQPQLQCCLRPAFCTDWQRHATQNPAYLRQESKLSVSFA